MYRVKKRDFPAGFVGFFSDDSVEPRTLEDVLDRTWETAYNRKV